MSTTQDPLRRRFVKMPMSKRQRKERTSGEWRLRALRRIVALLAAAPDGGQGSLTCRPSRVLGLAAGVGASAKARSRARGGVHRLRVLSGLAPVACGVLLMLAALPSEALASTNWATGVEASLPANARTNPEHLMDLRVSCASAGDCTAVGTYVDSSGHRTGCAVERDVGHVGDRRRGVRCPQTPARTRTLSLDPVSCASAGNCTAVGDYDDSSGHAQGAAVDRDVGYVGGRRRGVAARKRRHEPERRPRLGVVRLGGELHRRRRLRRQLGPPLLQDQGLLLTETSGTWATGVDASPARRRRHGRVRRPARRCRAPRRGTAPPSATYQDSSLNNFTVCC